MIPGAGTPGRPAIGQITEGVSATASGVAISIDVGLIAGVAKGSAVAAGQMLVCSTTVTPGSATGDGVAQGSLIVVDVALMPGVAAGQQEPIRFAGGVAHGRARCGRDATASGALVGVSASLIPGVARVGHEITVKEADGTTCVHTFFGLTDEELADEELMILLIEGEQDTWLLRQHEDEDA